MNDVTEGPYQYSTDPGTLEYTQECMVIQSTNQGNPLVCQRKALELSGNSLPADCESELELVVAKLTKDPHRLLKRKRIIKNVPEERKDKNYILEELETFLNACSKQGATIWYFGDGQQDTGNWCFSGEAFITFSDILQIYRKFFKGKILTVVSDCPWSGQWALDCVQELDRRSIPSCGHHTREKQLLIKVYASCGADQIATEAWFITNAVNADEQSQRLLFGGKSTENQTPTCYDFTRLQCCKDPYEKCDANEWWKWSETFLQGDSRRRRLYLVRGKDRGKTAWHYVLIKADIIGEFLKRVDSGTIDVADYGQVLRSGWGQDPPEGVKQRFSCRF